MLILLRRIRQKLLYEGSLKKYMLYAVGEIFLLVIGILIALQINNWNEAKKARKIELYILKEIHKNLELDVLDLQENDRLLAKSINHMKIILDYLDNKRPYDNTLELHLQSFSLFPHFWQNTSGFEMLKSRGLETISNEILRTEITYLYDNDYELMKTWEREILDFINIYVYKEEFSKFLTKNSKTVPKNYELLIEDTHFREIVSKNSSLFKYIYNRYFSATLKRAIDLNKRVNTEINQLE
ncbi:DUF6090 family protein [Arenibacter sp. S6351L]|uniref:DUF6090 family protein n=1 Tax=Arenibacter sp. S6351L TaxID=2926407 RepID=UPI001FF48FF2|nr:DUF6090 family protein [Arenibacter sp. S6351L]MCK0134306.1 DUF6090 family protein [Arenibacter sp. S6351L]